MKTNEKETIEVGIRVKSDATPYLTEILEIGKRNNCKHYQIEFTTFDRVLNIFNTIHNQHKSEISLYFTHDLPLRFSENNFSDQQFLIRLGNFIKSIEVKYLVFQPSLLFRSMKENYRFAELEIKLLDGITDLAEETRKFVVFENEVIDSGFSSIEVLEKLVTQKSGWWIRPGINFNNLVDAGYDLEKTWAELSKPVTIVTCDINNQLGKDEKTSVNYLLKFLYFLPYRQQPLIISNQIETLDSALKQVAEIIRISKMYFA